MAGMPVCSDRLCFCEGLTGEHDMLMAAEDGTVAVVVVH